MNSKRHMLKLKVKTMDNENYISSAQKEIKKPKFGDDAPNEQEVSKTESSLKNCAICVM